MIAEDSQQARFQAAAGRYQTLPELLEALSGASGGGLSQPFVGADIPGM